MAVEVKMTLSERDVERVESLRDMLHAQNKAFAVLAAVDISHTLAQKVKEGGTLLIRNHDGRVEQVVINGL